MAAFTDSGVAGGDYIIRPVAQGKRTGRREYPFGVRVLPVPDCVSATLGNYTGSTACISGGVYTISVQAAPSVANRITISNLDKAGLQIYADGLCNTGGGSGNGSVYLNVPPQTVNGVAYSGYGGYNPANSSGGQPNIAQSNLGNRSYYFIR